MCLTLRKGGRWRREEVPAEAPGVPAGHQQQAGRHYRPWHAHPGVYPGPYPILCSSVSDPGGSGFKLLGWIRIRIRNPDPGPESEIEV